MPECDYCEAAFEDEETYLEHLADAHEGELGAIDKRRVASAGSESSGLPTGPAILVGLLVVALALTAYVVVFMGDGQASTVNGHTVAQSPGDVGTVHEHGTMNVTIDGRTLDFSQERYQLNDRAFHFEGGDGQYWHKHATGVTLQYALATLDIGVNETSVTYEGTTYVDGKNADVTITVNGSPVDPATYVLSGTEQVGAGGDHVRVVVVPQ